MRLALTLVVHLVGGAALAQSAARPPVDPLESALEEVRGRIGSGKRAEAQRLIDEARKLRGDDPPARAALAYHQATLHAYAAEWERAAQVLLEAIPGSPSPGDPSAFWTHNTVMMLREAQGDLAAALVECDQMTRAGRQGLWGKPDERAELVVLKDLWHQAYLLRMLAEQQQGPRRDATLRYAEAARKAYAAAAPRDHADSVAVLDGYFAALDGDRARALQAGRRVNVADNDDLEDLYLTVVALEVGGDKEAAAKVRDRILGTTDVYLAVPIMRAWLARDRDAARGRPARFSPRHPRGRP